MRGNKIYRTEFRKQAATKYKVGSKVKKDGRVYEVKAVDAFSTKEVYLAIQNRANVYLVVESKELDNS